MTQIKKIISIAGFLAATFTGTYSQSKLAVTSSAFAEGGSMPVKYTCAGNDVSPALTWSIAPKDTKSFAIIMDDPDAPMGVWVHWVMYNIPATITQLEEDFKPDAIHAAGGKNDFGTATYRGPCPPVGRHRYVFKVYALDKTFETGAGMTKQKLEEAMSGHVLAEGQLRGIFSR